jgi:hypothetical protein
MNRQQTPNGIDFSVDYAGKSYDLVTIYPKDNSEDQIREAKRWLYGHYDIPHGGITTEKQHSSNRQLMPLMG